MIAALLVIGVGARGNMCNTCSKSMQQVFFVNYLYSQVINNLERDNKKQQYLIVFEQRKQDKVYRGFLSSQFESLKKCILSRFRIVRKYSKTYVLLGIWSGNWKYAEYLVLEVKLTWGQVFGHSYHVWMTPSNFCSQLKCE